MARLTSLKLIDLSFNLFEGFSFGSLANHSRLAFVRCICNDKDVEIETESSDWVPLFQLDFLVISNCNLNKLSIKVPTFLLHQHNLRVLDLSNNMLKGRLPSLLFENNMRLEYVSLNDNSFLGQVHLPLCLNTCWMHMSNNQLIGKLQGNIREILPHIFHLKLSNNSFTGSLPSSIGNMSLLGTFDLSLNNFSGQVPKELLERNNFSGPFDWLSLFNLTGLFLLKINHNHFSRAMSNELLNWVFLALLDVSNNYMSGKIPTWICNQTSVSALFL